MVGWEWLKDIRDRAERRYSKKVSVKRRKANRKVSCWSFTDVQAKIAYKTRLSGGVPIWVDADTSGQGCSLCGHAGRENRPNNGLLFVYAVIHSRPILWLQGTSVCERSSSGKTGQGRGDC